jgi:galactokinase
MSGTDRILSALTTVIRINDKVEAIAGLMKEPQRRLDDLHGRVIRLETMLEIALSRPPAFGTRLLDGGPVDAGSQPG